MLPTKNMSIHYSPQRKGRFSDQKQFQSGGKVRNFSDSKKLYDVEYNGKKYTLNIQTGTLTNLRAPFSVRIQNKNTDLNELAEESLTDHWMGIYSAGNLSSNYAQQDISSNEIIQFSAKSESIKYFKISGNLILDGQIPQKIKARLILRTHFGITTNGPLTETKKQPIQSELHLTRFLKSIGIDVILCPNSEENDDEAIILNAHKFIKESKGTLVSRGNSRFGFFTKTQLFSPTGKAVGPIQDWDELVLGNVTTISSWLNMEDGTTDVESSGESTTASMLEEESSDSESNTKSEPEEELSDGDSLYSKSSASIERLLENYRNGSEDESDKENNNP